MTSLTQSLVLAQTVRTTPLINGFSYPFLRLLANEARSLIEHRNEEKLWKKSESAAGLDMVDLTARGCALFASIQKQLNLKYYNLGGPLPRESLVELLLATETFLSVFEEDD